jgi:hypothetical protein
MVKTTIHTKDPLTGQSITRTELFALTESAAKKLEEELASAAEISPVAIWQLHDGVGEAAGAILDLSFRGVGISNRSYPISLLNDPLALSRKIAQDLCQFSSEVANDSWIRIQKLSQERNVIISDMLAPETAGV